MFIDEKIACRECQLVLRNNTGIFKAIFGVQMTDNGAVVPLEVFGSDQDHLINFESNHEMGRVLKLVARITAKIGNMPPHAERNTRA